MIIKYWLLPHGIVTLIDFQHSVLVICVKTLKCEDIYGLEGDQTL